MSSCKNFLFPVSGKIHFTFLQKIGGIIEEVMKQYTMSATENLKFEVERLQDDLEFKLEKTNMPRPQVLGMNMHCFFSIL